MVIFKNGHIKKWSYLKILIFKNVHIKNVHIWKYSYLNIGIHIFKPIFFSGIGTSYSRSHCYESRHDCGEDWNPSNHTSRVRQLVKTITFLMSSSDSFTNLETTNLRFLLVLLSLAKSFYSVKYWSSNITSISRSFKKFILIYEFSDGFFKATSYTVLVLI